MNTRTLGLLAAGLIAVSPCALAAPSLLGTQVTIQYFDNIGPVPDPSPEPVLVQAGAEVVCPSDSPFCGVVLFDNDFIDISESSISLNIVDLDTFADPSSFVFGSLFAGTNTKIVGVNVTISDLFRNLTESDVTFTDNSVVLDVSGVFRVPSDGNAELLIELVTRTPEPIPEPSTIALLGAGLLGLLTLRRRSARTQA